MWHARRLHEPCYSLRQPRDTLWCSQTATSLFASRLGLWFLFVRGAGSCCSHVTALCQVLSSTDEPSFDPEGLCVRSVYLRTNREWNVYSSCQKWMSPSLSTGHRLLGAQLVKPYSQHLCAALTRQNTTYNNSTNSHSQHTSALQPDVLWGVIY